MPKEFVENLCNEYRGTVYYDRYIRGLWVAAEGAVYKLFNDAQTQNPNPFKVYEKPLNIMEINIGVDFGGSGSGHAFCATGYTRGYMDIVPLASEWIDCSQNDIDPEKLGKLFVDFCLKVLNLYGHITHVYCDSAEQTLIAGLRVTSLAISCDMLAGRLQLSVSPFIQGALPLYIAFHNSMCPDITVRYDKSTVLS